MTSAAFKKQLLKRIDQYQDQLATIKTVSYTRMKHMNSALFGVKEIINDINPKWTPEKTAKKIYQMTPTREELQKQLDAIQVKILEGFEG
jgi:sugar-specific transcriptional regulator TrmB